MRIKHCIIVKWKNKLEMENKKKEIESLFQKTLSIEGISKVELIDNVIDRANRYDLLIGIEMEEEALLVYDNSEYHKMWKETYGSYIESKAIFDYKIG